MKILLIEDDAQVADYVARGMMAAKYNIQIARTGTEGLDKAQNTAYDALIVDRMLPGVDGLTIIQTLRESGDQTPALILRALGEVDDRVKGLRAGGDDYLTKPFALEELLARIEVMVRRNEPARAEDTILIAGDLELSLIDRTVTRGGHSIELQGREFKLLEYMMRNKGKTVTRDMLLEHVWNYHFDPQTNVIDVHISRLRQKVDKGFDSQRIKTVRGAGYTIDDST